MSSKTKIVVLKAREIILHRNLYLTWNTFDLTFDLYVCSFP